MPQQPFKFIHAARLLLDHQLSQTNALPPKFRTVARDATLSAFERLIDCCLERNVDFLLLSGDCFDHKDQGLRGQITLARGLERLAAKQIPVFIICGKSDPQSAWLPGVRYSSNVFRFGIEVTTPVPIIRDDETIAMVYGVETRVTPPESDHAESSAGETSLHILDFPHTADLFSIGLLYGDLGSEPSAGPLPTFTANELAKYPLKYWACGGGETRRTVPAGVGWAHVPGALQAVHPQDTGAHGCSLVEVDATGTVRQTFISTAPVRWEEINLAIAPTLQREELLELMRTALKQIDRQSADRVWLISWKLCGQGPLLTAMSAPEFRDHLLDELHADPGVPAVMVWSHALHLDEIHALEAEPALNADASDLPLEMVFAATLEERQEDPNWSLEACLENSSLHSGPWEIRLESWMGELDQGELSRDARRLGMSWFAGEEELSS